MKLRVRKPSIVKLFGRKDFLTTGPIVTDDGVIIGCPGSVTVKLDRASLTQREWEVPSDNMWLVRRVGSVVVGSGGHGVDAIRIADGHRAWRIPTGYVDAWRDEVTVVDKEAVEIRSPESGELRRSIPLPWPAYGSAKVCGRSLLVQGKTGEPFDFSRAEEFWLSAIDQTTEGFRWRRQTAAECAAFLPPVSEGDYTRALAVVFGNDDLLVVKYAERLFGLSPATGEILWQAPPQVRLTTYELTVIGNRAYVPGWYDLIVIDLATGDIVATCTPPELKEAMKPNPGTVFGERVAFTYATGDVVVYDRDGSLVSAMNARQRFFRTVEADGRLVASATGGAVTFDASIWGPH